MCSLLSASGFVSSYRKTVSRRGTAARLLELGEASAKFMFIDCAWPMCRYRSARAGSACAPPRPGATCSSSSARVAARRRAAAVRLGRRAGASQCGAGAPRRSARRRVRARADALGRGRAVARVPRARRRRGPPARVGHALGRTCRRGSPFYSCGGRRHTRRSARWVSSILGSRADSESSHPRSRGLAFVRGLFRSGAWGSWPRPTGCRGGRRAAGRVCARASRALSRAARGRARRGFPSRPFSPFAAPAEVSEHG